MGYFDDNFDRLVGMPRDRPRRAQPARRTDYSTVGWTTARGEMLVSEMTESHRQNALNVLVRRHGKDVVRSSLTGRALIHYGARL